MASVGNLFLSMSVRASEVDAGITKVEQRLQRMTKSIESQNPGANLADMGTKATTSAAGIAGLTAASGGLATGLAAVTAVSSTLSLGLDAVESGFSVVGGAAKLATAPIRGFIGLASEAASEALNLARQFLGLKTGLDALNVGVEYERQIARVKALTGATGQQFDALSQKAQKIGRDTEFTAGQAAEAMSFLAQSGFNPTEIIQAADATIQLASTAQINVEQAADIAAKIMRGMRIQAQDFGATADVLAMAMTNSNTNMLQLGDAFKYVAPVAVVAGKGIHEITAAIMALSDAGIQADMAGTTLSMMMMKIGDQSGEAQAKLKELGITFSDDAGNLKSIPDIIDHIGEKIAHLSTEAKLAAIGDVFGARAGRGVLSMVAQGGDAIRARMKLLGDSAGKAAQVSATQLDTVWGSIKIIQSSWEALLIQLHTGFQGEFKSAIDGLMGTFNAIGSGIPQVIGTANELGSTFRPMIDELNGSLRELIHNNGPAWQALFDGLTETARQGVHGIKVAFDELGTLAPDWNVDNVKAKMLEIGVAIEFGAKNSAAVWDHTLTAMELGLVTLEQEFRYTFEDRIPRAIAIAPLVAFGLQMEGMRIYLHDVWPKLMEWQFKVAATYYQSMFNAQVNLAKASFEIQMKLFDQFLEYVTSGGQSGGNFNVGEMLANVFTNATTGVKLPGFDVAGFFPDRMMSEQEKRLHEKLAASGAGLQGSYQQFLEERMKQLNEGTQSLADTITQQQQQRDKVLGGSTIPGVNGVGEPSRATSAVLQGSREAMEKATEFKLSQEDSARAEARRKVEENTKRAADLLHEINNSLHDGFGGVLGF